MKRTVQSTPKKVAKVVNKHVGGNTKDMNTAINKRVGTFMKHPLKLSKKQLREEVSKNICKTIPKKINHL